MYIGKFGHLREVSKIEKMYIGEIGHLREREKKNRAEPPKKSSPPHLHSLYTTLRLTSYLLVSLSDTECG
jgi:hypothetical protein